MGMGTRTGTETGGVGRKDIVIVIVVVMVCALNVVMGVVVSRLVWWRCW